ncbi:MAG: xanthine dehydrogenase family protein molybdopterin-binding subunit [Desulfobacterota bacterium]|nr:xanthine dehydrogenase family protein molybdopterin-binding subunit [Thermodesulfobacteriota bacterium]
MRQIGKGLPKVDALDKVLGKARFGADLPGEDFLHLKVVRSRKPHAKILGLEMAEALKVEGVERIFTSDDIPGKNLVGTIKKDQPVLAKEKVRSIGDAVALVAARTMEAAEEAARRVIIHYEDLPCLRTPEEALRLDAPAIHEGGNLLIEFNLVKGDVQKGFQEADLVVEKTYETTWVDHAYLEPDAGIAYIDEAGRITVVCPTQNVHYDQKEVASVLSLPLEKVRIIQSSTGGGFGGRLDLTVQPYLALAVYHLRRPVRIVYSREEVFEVISKRHPLKIRYRSGAKRDGQLTAVEVEILGDTGAYASYGPTVGIRSAIHATGPYQVPNVKVLSRMVYTNNPWSGAMRGFGVPQVAFAHESQMDLLAEALGIDPIEIRLKNALTVGSETATGQRLKSSVGIGETLRRVKEWRDQNRFSLTDPSRPHLRRGIGIASMWYGIGNTGIANPSTAQVEISPEGRIRLYTGVADIGQGSDTVLLQIAAEALGVSLDQIDLIRADTAKTTDAGATSASRQTYISGNAILEAVKDLKERVLEEASSILREEMNELFIEEAAVRHRKNRSLSIPLGEVARMARRVLRGEGSFDPETTRLDPQTGQGSPYATYAFATHLAEVEVDIESGKVKVVRVVACHDVGRPIHPKNVVGQIIGGVAMGVGFALMEEYQPGETVSFVNYLIPTSKDVPEVVPLLVEETEPSGPFGAKGVGEPALIPCAPAILNAINRAVGERIYQLPASLERVLEAVRRKGPPLPASGLPT